MAAVFHYLWTIKLLECLGWQITIIIVTVIPYNLCHTVELTAYITRFQWDLAKYPIKQPLKNIAEIISKVTLCDITGPSVTALMSHEYAWFMSMKTNTNVS